MAIAGPPETDGISFVEDAELKGLRMRLREIPFKEEVRQAVPRARTERLRDARTSALLVRLDELKTAPPDQTDFRFRKSSAPPPRPDHTIAKPFPSDETAPPPDLGKPAVLEVLRHAPEGDVPLAPHLAITFSKPMVAVTSQEAAADTVPVILRPTPKGQWRWLGTRTLMFDPDERFPMATNYEVKVPR